MPKRTPGLCLATVLLSVTLSGCGGEERSTPEEPSGLVWHKTFGGSRADEGYALSYAFDEGYIIAGRTWSFGAGASDVYLAKTDSVGNIVGQRTFGGSGNDYARDIAITTDGGFVVAGASESFGSGSYDVLLIKLDLKGDTVWSRVYGGPRHDEGWSVAARADGTYLIVGSTRSYGAGNDDAYVLCVNAQGNTLWTRTLGGTEEDRALAVAATTDGGCVVAGMTRSFGRGVADVYLVKLNAEGDSVWAKTFGSPEYDRANCVIQTTDLGYVLTGATHYQAPAGDVLLLKTDAQGDSLWAKTYGSYQGDEGWSVASTFDGGYIIAGFFTTPADPETGISADAYLIRTDSAGNAVWERHFGGSKADQGYAALPAIDGGFLLLGSTWSFASDDQEVYWIKTDSQGRL